MSDRSKRSQPAGGKPVRFKPAHAAPRRADAPVSAGAAPLMIGMHRALPRRVLLAGVSALTLFATAPSVHAKPLGSWTPAPSAAALAASQSGQQDAARAARDAQNSLKRATQAIQAMQAAQAAARDAARPQLNAIAGQPPIPDGIGERGLDPLAGGLWQGARPLTPGSQTSADGRTKVTIEQTRQKAILDWRTFNVGTRTDVNFDQQGNTSWVALNRVAPGTGPSQILGSIKADGSVYVINQNGIIFGGASQINVGTLIASTANISNDQFLNSGIYSAQSGTTYIPSFTGASGAITVEAGAVIQTNAPSSVTSGGGFVLLMGKTVENAGSIATPNGQAMLAAGDDFVLRPGVSTDANPTSTTRGNEIATGTWTPSGSSGTWVPGGGAVTNSGLIFSQQGDITLAGRTVTQNGVLVSTTSVNTRGTIHLLNAATDTLGSITLGAAGVTDIIPELQSTDTALNSQRDALIADSAKQNAARATAMAAAPQFNNLSPLADREDQSRIEIVTGGSVVFKGGSLTIAQGGQVAVSAGRQVFTESGATIDVSGVRDVRLAMSSNNIQVNIQGNELRDSPANRDQNYLKNADVWIDIRDLIFVPSGTGGYSGDRYYTPGGLLEVSGYLANTAHTIGEWSAVGGTITLSAPAVIAQKGSIFDISGGSLAYQAGNIVTTNFLGSDGRLYNIDNARADMTYVGVGEGFIRKNDHWGITEVWMSPFGKGRESVRWEDGYTVGRDAGSLILSAPTSIFEGDILADVVTGSRQAGARPAGVTDGYQLAQNTAALAGQLLLGQYDATGLANANTTRVVFGDIASITDGLKAGDALPSDRANTAYFDAGLIDDARLGGLTIATKDSISVDAALTFAPGAQVTLIAPTVDIAANIIAHSGSVTVSNILRSSQSGNNALTTSGGLAQLTLEAGATIDTSGMWTNALIDPNDVSGLAFLNGGNVTFDSSQGVTLAAGSTINVSSGGAILPTGKTKGGTGGNVTLVADDPINNGTSTAPLILNGTINAAGVNGGGTLTISTGQTVIIGDDASLTSGTLAANTPAATSLKLAQNLTIPAGGILPIAIMTMLNSIPPNVPLPVPVAPGDQRSLGGGTTPGVRTQAAWTIPLGSGLQADDFIGGGTYRPGDTIPAGTNISIFEGTAPAGFVFPSNVFPSGIKSQAYTFTVPAGSITATPVTYTAGTVVPTGTVFEQNVAVIPTLNIKPSLFQGGFANYDVTGAGGILVVGGTQLNVLEPVYQFTSASYATPTGADSSSALGLWLPPAYIEDPLDATMTRRGGASLELRSQSNLTGGAIIMQPSAAITVDPGQSVTLDGFGQITIDGTITAHSGAINIISKANGISNGRNFDVAGTLLGNSIWIGGDAALDVSAQAVTALDQSGRIYGAVPNGGVIRIGGAGGFSDVFGEFTSTTDFIVIRPGAVLDASGANAIIDPNAGTNPGSLGGSFGLPFTIASNGGSILLDSLSGIYNDGTLRAWAGGVQGGIAGAAGGTLSITLETPIYQNISSNIIPAVAQVPSVLTITQTDQGSGLSTALTPGTAASALQFGKAHVSANAITSGGFDNVALFSRDVILFDGNVMLKAGQSISFAQGSISENNSAARVTIAAPYVLFGGSTSTKFDFATYASLRSAFWITSSSSTQAVLKVDADMIDFQDQVTFGVKGTINGVNYDFGNFLSENFVSQGDIRFLAPTARAGISPVATQVLSPGNLSFTAAQLYPVTGATAMVLAGVNNTILSNVPSDSTSSLTISRINNIVPQIPDSVFGNLTLEANYVYQGGIVRAPLGMIGLGGANFIVTANLVQLLPGSITSVSANGLTVPYGGTADGLAYTYAGTAATSNRSLIGPTGNLNQGINIGGQSVDVQVGAVLDLSGGGNLTGRSFITGRGGSVDVLMTPLINANPANTFSAAGNKVYAIVPGYGSAYAPISAEKGAGDPNIGQRITIPAGVTGLPAGTYTLLPSNYGLLPGAYRVEIGGMAPIGMKGAVAVGNGTYAVSGITSIANSNVKSALPSMVLVTSGAAVRSLSQYNEEGYSDFLVANAAQFGNLPPVLPADGKALVLAFAIRDLNNDLPSLNFRGSALFQAADGGIGGTAVIGGSSLTAPDMEIYADATGPTAGFDINGVSLSAAAIDAIAAPQLQIGGYENVLNGTTTFGITSTIGQNLYVRSGVTLRAADIVLTSHGNVNIAAGASVTTVGMGRAPHGSTDGYSFSSADTALVLSNEDLEFTGGTGNGAINVGASARLYSEGSLVFTTNGAVNIDLNASYGSRSLQLASANINIGDPAAMVGATVPTGIQFGQNLFNRLVAGAGASGVPALEKLVLSASQAVNFYGTTGLDATGGLELVINTPAMYGFGGTGDHATLSAGTLIWNGASGAPGSVVANGPGTGTGILDINVGTLVFGAAATTGLLDPTTYNRTTYGFSAVNITATGQVISNSKGSLSAYQAPSTTVGDLFGQSGTGGSLNIATPLLTGSAASVMAYNAGGAINVSSPAGIAPSGASSAVSGAEIDFNGDSVAIFTAVVLPSGKLVINANNDITIGAGARLDVSGQPVTIEGAIAYGFGGDITLSSAQGNITQQAGSTIDVSATGNDAGSLAVTAIGPNGQVSLGGTLLGASTPVAGDMSSHADGSFSVAAQTLASGNPANLSDDFAALNQTLTGGGFFASRSFDLRQGDLTIGNGVKAHSVTASVDGGSMTVNGTIDASGAAPGTIRLAAKNDLTLAASGLLDAHGNVLQVDSNGQPINASNKGMIELASTGGTLTLAGGSTMDVSTPDDVAYGEIEFNAQRGTIGAVSAPGDETSGDIRINVTGAVHIRGAQSVAVNGFWTYSPADPYGTIVQDNGGTTPVAASGADAGFVGMNQIDTNSVAFINNALGNTDLQNRLFGLGNYHLRPGVEIDGTPSAANPTGTLTIAGDIDLSGFRYGPNADRNPNSATYGAGEPGALVIRAGGDLDIVGSISDGFRPAPGTPDDNGWLLQAGLQAGSIETLVPIVLNSGTTFPNTAGLSLRYAIAITATTIKANAVIPTRVTLSAAYTIPAGTRLTAAIYDSGGNVLYPAGTVMTSATSLQTGMQLGAGFVVPGSANVSITAMTWPSGATLGVFTGAVTLSGSVTVPFEGIIPSGANVKMTDPTAPTRPTGSSGTQGSIGATAAMLPQGALSWSARLVSGADLDAADTRTVKPLSALKALGVSGNLTLTDAHAALSVTQKIFWSYPGSTTRYYEQSTSALGCVLYGCTVASVSQVTGSDPSVVRTGTGNLDLIAGGSFSEQSLFGVYTAGTQSKPVAVDGTTPAGVTETNNPYNTPRGVDVNGTLLGAAFVNKASAAQASYQAWYPENGGDVLLSAQGNVTGNVAIAGGLRFVASDQTGNWLWRQGGPGEPTAWWINFGTYARTNQQVPDASFVGFQGIGTLGGGNLTVIAGGNAGLGVIAGNNSGLDLVVASTGRVLTDGTIMQTGGGNLVLKVGGALNDVSGFLSGQNPDQFGSITDLRGDINIRAGSIGTIGILNGTSNPADPRGVAMQTIELTQPYGGLTIMPGDGTVQVSTRGNLVLAGMGDAGMVKPVSFNGNPKLNSDGTISVSRGWDAWFTLWTPVTSVALFSAGGDVVPQEPAFQTSNNSQSGFYPGTLSIVAAAGNIRFFGSDSILELAPSPQGQLKLLAGASIFGTGGIVAMSGADMASLATPRNPVFGSLINLTDGNSSPNAPFNLGLNNPIAFGPDTPTTNLHEGDRQPALIYAGADIVDLQIGDIQIFGRQSAIFPTPSTWYMGAKPFQIIAGRDIVGAGTASSFILNNDKSDVSVIRAGRDIIYETASIGGPGLLDVQAGRNFYAGGQGRLDSVGPLVDVNSSNSSGGASISLSVGAGANGPDWIGFAKLYLDPANLADPSLPLADQPGKVATNYDDQLLTWVHQNQAVQFAIWLQKNPDYKDSPAAAYAFFQIMNGYQQNIFLRQVYFTELTISGREETGAISSPRLGSYLRGREAIAALFPSIESNGQPITYDGSITMFSAKVGDQLQNGGISTLFGGDIQLLTPGGQTIIGAEGITPGGNAGLLTQGAGNIEVYSLGSILLGQSRIMTTFGGDIVAWSAEGDINAGRGSKTTTVFSPPRRVYDIYGNVTLAPTVPSTGAGIATLQPIPGVPRGSIDLIAPLGTIDAGEAGIRSSGNVNLAALQIINAANIQAQGTTTGVPQIQAPNIASLTQASNTAGAAAQQAATPQQGSGNAQPSIIIVEVLGFGGGDGASSPGRDGKGRDKDRQSYDTNAPVQVVGHGALTEMQLSSLTAEERQRKLKAAAGHQID